MDIVLTSQHAKRLEDTSREVWGGQEGGREWESKSLALRMSCGLHVSVKRVMSVQYTHTIWRP